MSGFFNKWIPWINPDKVKDEDHFELNSFLNAWHINPHSLCSSEHFLKPSFRKRLDSAIKNTFLKLGFRKADPPAPACTLNSDGSYDLEMVIEFFPQRWFYLGLIISSITFISCLGYLIWDWRKRRKLNNLS